MRVVRLGCAAALLAAGTGPAVRALAAQPALVAGSRQLILVTAAGWDDTTGELRRYERATAGAAWQAVGAPVPVVLGRTGLAWGVGQGSIPDRGAVPKREGDGRSPAGVFGLLHTFGYAAPGDTASGTRRGDAAGAGLPHVVLAPGTVCVDDPASPLYNTVADAAAAARARWESAERMREVAGYRAGVAVAYNGARTEAGGVRVAARGAAAPGRGSCIFLHVWDGPGRPTAGCTAMNESAARTLAAWLAPGRRPVLVQLPRRELARRRGAWGLP